MNNLSRFDQDGIELIIDTQTGESFATVSGYARMSGKAKSTVSERLTNVQKDLIKEAEIQTPGGLQGVRLITEDLICEWLPKDNPTMAGQLLKLGVRVFLHKMAGFEIKSTATEDLTTGDMLVRMAQAYKVIEDRQKALEEQLKLEAQRTNELEELVRQHDTEIERYHKPCGDYYSVMGYLRLKKIAPISLPQAQQIGKKASNLCKKLGLTVEPIRDPRFGTINSYPEEILEQVI